MIYNDLIDDIKSADYVLFGLGKEIYSSDDTEIYDNLKKLFASMEHVNYFIVSTDKAGTIRNCGLNERRIVCPVNENNAEEEEKQWDFYNKWLSSSLAKKLVIVELGEDFSNPNVIRWPFERIVMINQKAKMYRVHSTFYQIPDDLKETFTEAVKRGCDKQRQYLVEANEEAETKLKELGVTFYEIDKDELKAKVVPAMESYKSSLPQEWLDAIERGKKG